MRALWTTRLAIPLSASRLGREDYRELPTLNPEEPEKILKYTKLSETEVYTVYYDLLRHVRFFDEGEIDAHIWTEAQRLCSEVDPKDTVYIAAALSLNAYVRTGDKELREGLETRGFTQFRSTAELSQSLA